MAGQMQTTNSPEGDKANRRRTRIINPRFQWRYASIIATVVFLFTCTLSFVLFGMLHHQARMRVIDPTGYVADVAPVIIFFGVVFAIVTAAGVGVWSAFAAQKICGPLYVLERYLTELGKGKFPNPRPLRRKDEFKELYATFSETVNAMKEARTAELATMTRNVKVARAALSADDESRIQALTSVADDMEQLRQAMAESLGEGNAPSFSAPSLRAESNEPSPVGTA